MKGISVLSMALGLFAAGCGPIPNPGAAGPPDLRPPAVMGVRTVGPREIEIAFDEEASVMLDDLVLAPALAVNGVSEAGGTSILSVDVQEPGRKYTLRATAEDARGNGVSFIAELYGFNPRIPLVLLNEFTPRGSSAHPDLVECAVLSDGNMGGVVLYHGIPEKYESRLIFPAFEVKAGDFMLIHFKPSGDPAEKDETLDKTASGGIDASDTAFDFWIRDGSSGLGGNNGALCLHERPGGGFLDGVLYSNGVFSPDRPYRGFGTARALLWAEGLAAGGWKTAGDEVWPDDGVNPEDSTATRSICRSSDSRDTDSREDWHIVPTRKSTFGAPNSDEVYVP